MWRVVLVTLAVLFQSACAPSHNPIMAFGRHVNTGTVPLQEYKVYFNEPVKDIYSAIIVAGNRNGLTVTDNGGGSFVVTMSYDFSMMKNIWGGNFRVGLDRVDQKTRMTASFYEKSEYVVNSILNPFVEDVKTILLSSNTQGWQQSGGR
jgi:hypothetical protein